MFLEEFELGKRYVLGPILITKEDLLEFARKYDNLPLHTDEEYAKKTRFGTLIAPGMFSLLTVWDRFLELNCFGDELIAGKSTKTEWLKPVFVADTLTGELVISRLTPRNKYNGIVESQLTVYNQKREIVLESTTEVVVKRRSE
ncbi:MaoC family dehydratase [Candidatus Methanomassiliicoccus intestinalis]|uniref:MaoC family dehydratase n=1 Tax=Candidatus Methanomassiliicoccus intestinalis TaxID=1406512 RepID=UPI0037DC50B5